MIWNEANLAGYLMTVPVQTRLQGRKHSFPIAIARPCGGDADWPRAVRQSKVLSIISALAP
jgi:hypothetical protein